ncbi:thioredoxin domain-containing protein [Candidatus Saccharibacteria bacterium]|nr:DsbA family protein [Candidatus Saccharibacteria bacterium]NIV04087.1 thioredoxin domain-containing protein [Calditrichia bacterium]NIS38644.1 DsbA family protein [Candidatus Saccharibacteria bacterium]NIV72486.1 thioredoxin domain-containing protein [Calditrichia bacterium]NIV99592.1 thioredoxin domain-containing protein [Candidatus Saccharibacteria bacterium]
MAIDPLKPYGIDEPTPEPLVRPWYTHWWGVFLIVIFGIIFVGGSWFGWRVYSYYQKVKSGELRQAIIQVDGGFTGYTTNQRETSGIIPFFDVITQDDPQIGPEDATITIIEFADFMCPYCADASLTVRGLVAEYPNDIRYIFRDFPIEELHPGSSRIHIAGECAKEQGKFWPFHDKIFQNQESVTPENVSAYAAQAGISISEFDYCMNSGKYDKEVEYDINDGRRAGVVGTPTFFVNGIKIEGALKTQDWETLVQTFLSAVE